MQGRTIGILNFQLGKRRRLANTSNNLDVLLQYLLDNVVRYESKGLWIIDDTNCVETFWVQTYQC